MKFFKLIFGVILFLLGLIPFLQSKDILKFDFLPKDMVVYQIITGIIGLVIIIYSLDIGKRKVKIRYQK